MPKGYPGTGKAAPRKPAIGGAVTEKVTTSPAVNPVREQVKQMSGFANLEELKAAVPESTALPTEKKERKKRAVAEVSDDPNMSDPKYKEAIGNMTAFGGKKVVSAGFSTAATILKDDKFKLDAEENKVWDEYFYVVSKRSNFDPSSPWFLAVYFVVMLLTQLGARLWERSGYKGLFSIFEKLEPKRPQPRPVQAVPNPGDPEGMHRDGARSEFSQ